MAVEGDKNWRGETSQHKNFQLMEGSCALFPLFLLYCWTIWVFFLLFSFSASMSMSNFISFYFIHHPFVTETEFRKGGWHEAWITYSSLCPVSTRLQLALAIVSQPCGTLFHLKDGSPVLPRAHGTVIRTRRCFGTASQRGSCSSSSTIHNAWVLPLGSPDRSIRHTPLTTKST